jgi:P-type conjugative transfer protein TrbJ
MFRRTLLAMIVGIAMTIFAQPAQAWFGWSLPYFVFDSSRFAQQVQAVQAELQWIESVRRHLDNDVRMLRMMEFSNVGQLTTGLQRLESAAARIDTLAVAPQRVGNLISRDAPIDWTGMPHHHTRFDSTRRAWVFQQRQMLTDVRAVHNSVAIEMGPTRDRVEQIVGTSNNAQGLTEVLQARTQLNGELSSELAKLQMLRATRAAMRSDRSARDQSQEAHALAVTRWLNRTDGVTSPAQGQGTYSVEPIPETSGGHP